MTLRNDANEKLNDKSVQSYFTFLRLVIAFNFVLFLFQSFHYLFFISSSKTLPAYPYYLFTYAYSEQQSSLWTVFNLLCFVVAFLVGPVYYIATSSEMLDKEPEQHVATVGNKTDDVIRIMFIYIPGFFGLLVCLYLNVTFVLPFVTHHYIKDPMQGFFLYACMLSAFMMTTEKLVQYSANQMRFASNLVQQTCVLLFSLGSKLIILITFDAFERASYKNCFQFEHGMRYFLLVCTEIAFCNAKDTIYPYLKMKYAEWKQRRAHGSNYEPLTTVDTTRLLFHVESEYLELLFRQYVIYSTMLHMPMITLFYTVLCIAQFFVDRLRLAKISQLPDHHTQVSTTKSYQFLLILVLVGICVLAAVAHVWRYYAQEVYILETCVLPKSILSEALRTKDFNI